MSIQPDADFDRTGISGAGRLPDRSDFRIWTGPAFGSASQREARRKRHHSRTSCRMRSVVAGARTPVAPLKCSNSRELDLFATNKPTLFAMSDQMPGRACWTAAGASNTSRSRSPRAASARTGVFARLRGRGANQRFARRGRGARGPQRSCEGDITLRCRHLQHTGGFNRNNSQQSLSGNRVNHAPPIGALMLHDRLLNRRP